MCSWLQKYLAFRSFIVLLIHRDVSQVLSKVIVCLVADREMELGLLKVKLEALRSHLAGPLALVFQTPPT